RHRGRPDGWPLSSSDAGQKAQPRLFVSGDAKSTPGEILPAGQATDTFDLSGLTYATPGWTASVDEPVGPGEAVVALSLRCLSWSIHFSAASLPALTPSRQPDFQDSGAKPFARVHWKTAAKETP